MAETYDVLDQYGGKIGEVRRGYDIEGGLATAAVSVIMIVAVGVFIAAGWLLWQVIKLCARYPRVMLPLIGLVVGGIVLAAALNPGLLASPSAAAPAARVASTAPVATPAPARPPAGAWVAVANTGGDGVYLREGPAGARVLAAWADGAMLEAVGPEETAGGRRWRQVRDRAGVTGWVAADYLAAADAPAAPGAAPTPTWLVVANTGGDGVFLRRSRRLDDKLVAWPDGTRLAVAGPDGDGDGRRWQQVRDPKGQVGWVPAEYVVPAYRAE